MPGITVRQYQAIDAAAMADIFAAAYGHLAGMIARSPTDFEWRFRSQPGISEEGCLVAVENDGGVTGYAFVKDNGDVIDFAVRPGDFAREAASRLLAECEAVARSKGALRLRLHFPHGPSPARPALARAGMAPSAPEARYYVSAVDPGRLVRALVRETADLGSMRLEVINTKPLDWQPTVTLIETADTPLHSLSLEGEPRTFNEVLLGGSSPSLAIATGRLRVRPVRSTPMAIRALRRIRASAPWFYALGDIL